MVYRRVNQVDIRLLFQVQFLLQPLATLHLECPPHVQVISRHVIHLGSLPAYRRRLPLVSQVLHHPLLQVAAPLQNQHRDLLLCPRVLQLKFRPQSRRPSRVENPVAHQAVNLRVSPAANQVVSRLAFLVMYHLVNRLVFLVAPHHFIRHLNQVLCQVLLRRAVPPEVRRLYHRAHPLSSPPQLLPVNPQLSQVVNPVLYLLGFQAGLLLVSQVGNPQGYRHRFQVECLVHSPVKCPRVNRPVSHRRNQVAGQQDHRQVNHH